MKKSVLALALGDKPSESDEDVSEDEESDDSYDAETDSAIETFLDTSADMETRVAAFRRAVEGC